MKKVISTVTAALLLSACGSSGKVDQLPLVQSNFQYSNAGGLGTQNAGFLEPGTFFVWNRATSELTKIGNLRLTKVPSAGSPAAGKQESTSVAGVKIEGIPASLSGQESAIKAGIEAKSKFSADGVIREDYEQVKTMLSAYVTSEVVAGRNPDLILKPRDRNYRVVVINSAIRATESTLSIGGTDTSDPNKVAEISIGTGDTTLGLIRVKAGTNTSCGSATGTNGAPICFFNVAVYDPQYVEGVEKLQWLDDTGDATLSDAFRKLR